MYNIKFVMLIIKIMEQQFAEISILKDNIAEIIVMYENQKSVNKKLEQKIEELTKIVEIREHKILDLKKQFETLRIAKTITSSSKDAHDAKIRINKIVREIDTCMGLLNK